MGFATKGFVLLQLTVLLLSCFTVFGEVHGALPPTPSSAETPSHHHYHHQHSHPPAHPPTYHHYNSPPPSQAPAHPPSHDHHHHHHHHGYPPVHPPHHAPGHPPVHPPSHPPHDAPSHTPVHPPVHHPVHPPRSPPSPRSFVAVQGVVYCKSCKHARTDNLLDASPILGATVKLQCHNTEYPLVETAKTDKNGYFFITAPKSITSYGAHKCKVFLVSSPLASCNKPSNLNDGLKGSILKPEKPYVTEKLPFVLYTVGPFAFDPKCPL